MLNYIWALLLAFSLIFALGSDWSDYRHDTFRNHQAIPVKIRFEGGMAAGQASGGVEVRIDPRDYAAFYGGMGKPAASYEGTVTRGEKGVEIKFARDVPLPEPLTRIREAVQSDYAAVGELQGSVEGIVKDEAIPAGTMREAKVTLQAVYLPRLAKVTKAAFYFAGKAVSLALDLIGVLALWLGLLRIAEKSGLVEKLVKVVQPLLRHLFPEIPRNHPAIGMVAINLSASMLGLGNAATPMGLKAMEELQTLNPSEDTATNPMVMLLALNTTCVQLVPPATLIAVLGLQAGSLYLPTVAATGMAMVVAVVAAKLLSKLPGYRRSNPNRPAEPAGEGS